MGFMTAMKTMADGPTQVFCEKHLPVSGVTPGPRSLARLRAQQRLDLMIRMSSAKTMSSPRPTSSQTLPLPPRPLRASALPAAAEAGQ